MRSWVVGIVIGACVLTSSCKTPETIPGKGSNPSAVKVVPPKEGLLKEKNFAEFCVSEQNLGKGETERCRDEVEIAESDRQRGWK